MAAMVVHLEEMRVSGVREAARQVNCPLNMKMTGREAVYVQIKTFHENS